MTFLLMYCEYKDKQVLENGLVSCKHRHNTSINLLTVESRKREGKEKEANPRY